MIEIKNEKVIINNKEEVLFGGELHYFRVPVSEWSGRIKQIKAAGGNMVSTYIPWIFHEQVEGEIDLTGKTRPEKDLQKFVEMIADAGMYCLVRPGPYVMAEIVDHGVPAWFLKTYPEASAKDEKGINHPVGLVSYLHPTFLEKAENWYKHVCEILVPFQITKGGPVIMFQLDNEVGMFHWVTNKGDFNDATLSEFQHYLEKKYTLEQFKTTYTNRVLSIAEFVKSNVKEVEGEYAFALQNDYSLFMRQHYRTYIEKLKEFTIDNGINLPWVINVHGFDTVGGILKRGMKYPIGLSQLLETAKIENAIIAGDYYIGNLEFDNYTDVVVANAFTKAIQPKNQPLFSAEFQGGCIMEKPRLQPSAFDLLTRLCFANGMNAVNYYMFVSGENYEGIGLFGKRHEWQAPLSATGKERTHYKSIQHLGRMFQTFNKQLLATKPVYHTHLAFYPDYFMTELHNPYTESMMKEMEGWREWFLFNGMAKALTVDNISYDGYNLLETEAIDVAKMPSLWVFSMKWMDEDVQQKLIEYMMAGGMLIIFPTLPTQTLKCEPCTLLKDFIDVKQKDMRRGYAIVEGMENVSSLMQTFEATDGAFAWTEDEHKDVVAFEKSLGCGKVVVFGLAMEIAYAYQFDAIRKMTDRIGIASDFAFSEDVEAINAFAREATDGSKFLFLQNFDEYAKETQIYYQGADIFDGVKINLAGKGGLILPLQVSLTADILIEMGTAEIFDCEHGEQTADVKVKNVKNATFIFTTSDYKPLANELVNVEQIATNRYRVTFNSWDEIVEFSFGKKDAAVG